MRFEELLRERGISDTIYLKPAVFHGQLLLIYILVKLVLNGAMRLHFLNFQRHDMSLEELLEVDNSQVQKQQTVSQL